MDFRSISFQFWINFWLIPELIFLLKRGPFGAPFGAKTQGITLVLALSGGAKGLHFGGTFGTICGLHFAPFWSPCFGAGSRTNNN